MNIIQKSNIQKIKTLYQIGMPIEKIADKFKITVNDVARICKGVRRL